MQRVFAQPPNRAHGALTEQEIIQATTIISEAISKSGVRFYFDGHTAEVLYGYHNINPSREIDVVLLQQEVDVDELEREIIASHSDFFHCRSSCSGRKHLWYSFVPGLHAVDWAIRINISHPMHSPNMPESTISSSKINNVPLAPAVVLLLMEVNTWRVEYDNEIETAHKFKLGYSLELLQAGSRAHRLLKYAVNINHDRFEDFADWLPLPYLQESLRNVVEYVKNFPESEQYWELLLDYQVSE